MKKILIISNLLFILISVRAQINDSLQKYEKEITIGTWNIGHFSRGSVDHSTVSSSNFEKELAQFRSFVNDSLVVDVLCVNEYSDIFYHDRLNKHIWAETSLFGGFKEHQIFKQNKYVCNAFFSKMDLKNPKMCPFLYSDSVKAIRNNIDWFYFTWADIMVGGKDVKLVCTHLINRAENLCQEQIEQLINTFDKYDRVIICGDMNTVNFSKFVEMGYTLANDGTLVTFPLRSDPLDNIIVKGLKISNVRVLKTNLSDHYPLVCKISL